MAECNTDEKLAKLAQRYPAASLSSLSKTLKACSNNFDAAVEALQKPDKPKHQPQASGSLDSWVNGNRKRKSKQQAPSSKKSKSQTHQVVDLISSDEEATPLPEKQSSPDHQPQASTSSSTPKPSINDVLRPQRQGNDPPPKETGPPPLLLGTPELVAQHTPCTLILNALPAELALACYCEMLRESADWQRNRWNIFDRDVESPHTTRFYYDQDEPHLSSAGSYWFNQQANPPKPFTSAINQVRRIVEPLVNDQMSRQSRLPYEWAGRWRANVAAANCYSNSKESVGFHSDRLNYLGPQTTICSISLGVTRNFRLRSQGDAARTFDVRLEHNSLLIMGAGCQESFKHAVPPQRTIDLFKPRLSPDEAKSLHKALGPDGRTGFTERINMTFRFYRPDFTPDAEGTPYPPLPRCRCQGQPLCVLRPDMKGKLAPDASTPYFWQCGGSGNSCGFFQVLDMIGRGPRVGDASGQTVSDAVG